MSIRLFNLKYNQKGEKIIKPNHSNMFTNVTPALLAGHVSPPS